MNEIAINIFLILFKNLEQVRDIKKFLEKCETKDRVYEFCIRTIMYSGHVSESALPWVIEKVKDVLDKQFEKLEHEKQGEAILNQIN